MILLEHFERTRSEEKAYPIFAHLGIWDNGLESGFMISRGNLVLSERKGGSCSKLESTSKENRAY